MKIASAPASNLREAASAEQPVILYCLSCGRARQMHAWALAGLLGAAPFGLIIGNLRCKSCGEKVGVVLPLQAPTPRAWANLNRIHAKSNFGPALPAQPPASYFHYQLETWTDKGGIEKCLALIDNLFIGHAAFAEAMAQYPKAAITLRAKAQVIRDSARPAVKPLD